MHCPVRLTSRPPPIELAVGAKVRAMDKDTIVPSLNLADLVLPSREDGLLRYSVAGLLGTKREAVLVLDGKEYRLRHTVNGKLILTK